MNSRTRLLGLAAFTLIALGFGATTLWAQPVTLTEFTLNGQGTTNFTSGPCAGLACSSGNPSDCGCDETTGSITGTNVSAGTFVIKDQLLLTGATGNGTSSCIPSSGTITVTANSGAVLKLNFSGPACKVPNVNWVMLGGGYGVVAGTLRFANAIGSGTLSRAKNQSNGDTTVSLVGNMSLNP